MFVKAKLFHKANESGGGSGAVESVNGKIGVVILDGEDIEATVGSTEDTISNHLNSLRNDLGDLADDVAEKTKKNVITLTGESGTLTSAQIAQVQDDTAVLEIVCDGEVFRLSNKDSTLTYRTFINTNCEASENVSFKVIYVQLNSEAVNYGAWTLEEVSAGGGASYTAGTGIDITNNVISNTGLINTATGTNSLTIQGTVVATTMNSINIGYGSSINVLGVYDKQTTIIGVSSSGNDNGVSIGYNATSTSDSVSIGHMATAYNSAVAVGKGASASKNQSISIGKNAVAGGIASIQLGYNGTNPDNNTLKVANTNGNFEIMSSDGTIPTDRFTTTPTTDGTYNATITVADGVVTRSWTTAGSGGGVSDVTVNGTSVVSGGVAAITVPTATSDLTNDSGFATISDSSTTSTTATWSASKLNTMIGNIESLLANI